MGAVELQVIRLPAVRGGTLTMKQHNKTYKAVLFAPDGAYVTDFRDSESIEDVQVALSEMGSRWIFYPIQTIADESDYLVDAPEEMYILIGLTIKEAGQYIKEHAQVVSYNIEHEMLVLE